MSRATIRSCSSILILSVSSLLVMMLLTLVGGSWRHCWKVADDDAFACGGDQDEDREMTKVISTIQMIPIKSKYFTIFAPE